MVTSPLNELENAFKNWELCSSLEERITRTEEFISIASLTLGGKEGSEELLASMLTVVTPILSSLEEHRKRATTMQLKMETSSSEALTDPHRAEAEIARLLLWTEITTASDRESFWDLVHQLDPKSAATNFTQLQKYCDWKFAPKPTVYESPGNIEFIGGDVDGRDSWLLQAGIGCGQTRIGMFSNGRGDPKLVCVSAMPLARPPGLDLPRVKALID